MFGYVVDNADELKNMQVRKDRQHGRPFRTPWGDHMAMDTWLADRMQTSTLEDRCSSCMQVGDKIVFAKVIDGLENLQAPA